jgi:hypothetical protein
LLYYGGWFSAWVSLWESKGIIRLCDNSSTDSLIQVNIKSLRAEQGIKPHSLCIVRVLDVWGNKTVKEPTLVKCSILPFSHCNSHTHRVNGAAYVLTYTYNNDEHSAWHAKCVGRVVRIRVFISKPRLLVCVCDRLIVGGLFVRSIVGSRITFFVMGIVEVSCFAKKSQ